jgi:aconitate hydratase
MIPPRRFDMSVSATTPIELVEAAYSALAERVEAARRDLGRPLTLAEKILLGHRDADDAALPDRGVSYNDLRPDRVAMQDATAQMALLQFMTAGLDQVAVPPRCTATTSSRRRRTARSTCSPPSRATQEVYDFLESVSARYDIGFWGPGSGIIHQVVLEQYAFPGGMMVGTDSHTPNAGGLGMIAIGVGGADAVDVMTGFPFNVRWPKLIGVHLTGELNGWSAPKDVILKVAEILTVKGGTGAIVEYFGPGANSISCTGKATICNMGAEIGATTSVFAYDDAMGRYLKLHRPRRDRRRQPTSPTTSAPTTRCSPTRRSTTTRSSRSTSSTLRPHINGPHTPDLAREVPKLGDEAREQGWPLEISSALVGSCTNSSYEDITRAASILRFAAANGLSVKVPLLITPGSEQVRATIERDGLLATFEAAGATVLANACGPCIGQWSRPAADNDHRTRIVTSYNRNFPKRNDGSANTLAFVTSPETVVALALAGTLDFDPLTDALTNDAGEQVRLPGPCRRGAARHRLHAGREHLRRPTGRPQRRRGQGLPHLRPAPAAGAVRPVGRKRLRTCRSW